MKPGIKERRILEGMAKAAKTKMDEWAKTHWKPITDQFRPYGARWYATDFNKAAAKDTTLINNTPPLALRILVAGLVASLTSPSRIWFHMDAVDKLLRTKHSTRTYIDGVERVIRTVLAQSGFYQSLAAGVYPDLCGPGTGGHLEEEEDDGSIRFEHLLLGTYALACDANGTINHLYHWPSFTVDQLVRKFGEDNVSSNVREMWRRHERHHRIDVAHLVFPNDDYREGAIGHEGMRFASRWWEINETTPVYVKVGGYHEFPGQFPRWLNQSAEPYGRGSPGWEAKGDAAQLQDREEQLAEIVDKIADPPMKASKSMRTERASLVPGDVTYVPDSAWGTFEPAYVPESRSAEILERHIARDESRVNRSFFVDLWAQLLNDPRRQRPTATEVEATREEVMLQLGPLLESLNEGLLEPVITRTFQILERQGRLPEAPPELEGTEGALKVEFISVLHQAQQMTGIVGIRELVAHVHALAQLGRQDALDKIDADQIVDEIAQMLGVKPEIVLSDDQVEEVRRAKAERQAAMEQGAAMATAAKGMADASKADPQKLEDLASLVPPGAAAQAGLMS